MDKINLCIAGISALMVAIIPMVTVIGNLYSDVNTMKKTKADEKYVMSIQLDFTKQMTRNTAAIESLNETLKEWRNLYGK